MKGFRTFLTEMTEVSSSQELKDEIDKEVQKDNVGVAVTVLKSKLGVRLLDTLQKKHFDDIESKSLFLTEIRERLENILANKKIIPHKNKEIDKRILNYINFDLKRIKNYKSILDKLESKEFSFERLFSKTGEYNVFEKIKNHYDINEDYLEHIYKTKAPMFSNTAGAGEFLLCLFFNDLINTKDKGDVQTKNDKILEVKENGARIGGGKTGYFTDSYTLIPSLNDYLNSKFKTLTSIQAKSFTKSYCKFLLNAYNKFNSDTSRTSFLEFFFNNLFSNKGANAADVKKLKDVSFNNLSYAFKSNDHENIFKTLGLIHLYFYINGNNIDYLIIFEKKTDNPTGNIKVIVFDKKDFNSVKRISNNFTIDTWEDNAPKIYYNGVTI